MLRKPRQTSCTAIRKGGRRVSFTQGLLRGSDLTGAAGAESGWNLLFALKDGTLSPALDDRPLLLSELWEGTLGRMRVDRAFRGKACKRVSPHPSSGKVMPHCLRHSSIIFITLRVLLWGIRGLSERPSAAHLSHSRISYS